MCWGSAWGWSRRHCSVRASPRPSPCERTPSRHPLAALTAGGGSATLVVELDDDPKTLRGKSFGGERQLMLRASLQEVRTDRTVLRAGGSILVFAEGEQWAGLCPDSG